MVNITKKIFRNKSDLLCHDYNKRYKKITKKQVIKQNLRIVFKL